jgi:hypothetical protein
MTPTLEQRGKKLASSRKWYQTERQQILLRLGGKCSKCGSTENLDVRDSHAARGGGCREYGNGENQMHRRSWHFSADHVMRRYNALVSLVL